MRILYTDLDIHFTIGNIRFIALNLAYERFLHSVPKHSHSSNSYEVHYIPQGYGLVRIGGVTYDVVPNTLYVTGPHVEHEQVPRKEDPMWEYCLYFKVETEKGKQKSLSSRDYISLFTQTTFWYGQDSQNVHPLMQLIFFELENKYTGYMTQVETLLQQCVIMLIRNYENKKESMNHFGATNLYDSKYLIIEECFLYDYKTVTLRRLSERLGLSTRQTERLLKRYYNKTFLQKRMEARMSAATILLAEDKKSISSVSSELGYSSVEHFSNAFKRYHHVTPREYKKRFLDR